MSVKIENVGCCLEISPRITTTPYMNYSPLVDKGSQTGCKWPPLNGLVLNDLKMKWIDFMN